jgi:hypothetical protein
LIPLFICGALYEEFTRCATQLDDTRFNDEEWDPYFLMQHHGVPTRLLDWSDGALVALHFAVRNKTAPFYTGALIYVLDSYWLDDVLEKDRDRTQAVQRWEKYCKKHPYDRDPDDWDRLYLPMDDDDDLLLATPKSPLLWDSPHVSRRVAAQRSRFMIFGTDPLWLSELAKDRSASVPNPSRLRRRRRKAQPTTGEHKFTLATTPVDVRRRRSDAKLRRELVLSTQESDHSPVDDGYFRRAYRTGDSYLVHHG